MTAKLIEKSRKMISETAFYEVVLWHLSAPVLGSSHPFEYRLALVVSGECVLRYDNERGKGDHRHICGLEKPIEFVSLEGSMMRFSLIWKGYCDEHHKCPDCISRRYKDAVSTGCTARPYRGYRARHPILKLPEL